MDIVRVELRQNCIAQCDRVPRIDCDRHIGFHLLQMREGIGHIRERGVVELEHIAIGVDDVYATCDAIRAKGGKVTREPGPMKHGGSVIAFVEDPNGYKIELIQAAAKGA